MSRSTSSPPPRPPGRARARLPALAAAAALLAGAPAAAQYAISQVPMLVSQRPTNLVLTIDDSGSMTSAFVPDSVGNQGASVAFTSSSYNALYYNPAFTYNIPPNAAGLQASSPLPQTKFTAAYLDGFNPGAGTVDLSASYQPTLTYAPGSTRAQAAIPNAAVGSQAYYYVYTGGTVNGVACATPNPTAASQPDGCFTQVVVSSPPMAGHIDETQNFANWFSFYRTRHLAVASAAAIAMSSPGLATPAVRVAWQGLTTCDDFTTGSCTGWNNAVAPVDNRIKSFVGQHRADFYTWLFEVPAANSTPTRTAWWRVGEYYRSSGKDSPYGVDPNDNSTSTAELACVNNFQVTMTDGQWNTDAEGQTNFCGAATCGNVDDTAVTLPDGTSYVPAWTATTAAGAAATAPNSTSIYGDYNTGGLADIAFYYWSNNLRPDLTGSGTAFVPSVPPYYADQSTTNLATGATGDKYWRYWNPRNDPATWPHMVNFAIGVGLTGYFNLPGLIWTKDSFGGQAAGSGYMNLLQGSTSACAGNTGVPYAPVCNWPTITPNGGNGNGNGNGNNGNGTIAGDVYDMWHATINSRGQAFSAESPLDLVNALNTIISRIESQAKGNSTAASSSPSLTAGADLYVGSYDAGDWHGVLSEYPVGTGANAGAVSTVPTWQTTDSACPVGSTSVCIPPYASRNVFTAASTTPAYGAVAPAPLFGTAVIPGSKLGLAFNAGNAAALATAGMGPYLGSSPAPLINYLLGDDSNEVANGGTLRTRAVTKLGDIVNSSPVFSWNHDFGYGVLPGSEGTSYAAFLNFKTTDSTHPGMVYVGANDGMLHGFLAANGQEQFAYIPRTVVPNLPVLASTSYSHRFYVDATPYVGDAWIDPAGGSNPAWRSVLVGTTGAGGPGVFALDVTTPGSFGAASVLWDIDANASPYGNGDPDLGYTVGQAVVARLNDGNWYAVFGNGYDSLDGCPVLYLVGLGGTNNGAVRKLPAGTSATLCTANGLGSPTLYDLQGDGASDYAYVGDLQGNLWKFDLTGGTASAWGVAKISAQGAAAPLFVAGSGTNGATRQPIVSAPNIGPGPNGIMLYFATGRMFAVGDTADTSVQSIYGIQDRGTAIAGRTTLVAQTVTPDGAGHATVSQNVVDLASVDGWVIDLPGSGERVLQTPLVVGGMVLFATVAPSGAACTGGCSSYTYAVSATSGGGGMDFLTDPTTGVFYDALQSKVGCIEGLTTIVSHSTLYIYGVGDTPFTGGTGGNTPPVSKLTPMFLPSMAVPTGSTGTQPGSPGQPGCSAPMQCASGTLPGTGRISWHEVLP